MKAKLAEILAESFPEADVRIESSGSRGKLGGIIVWKGFDGLDQVKRQRHLWKVLGAKLSADEQLKISAILTLAPVEALAG